MPNVSPGSDVEVLQYLHAKLDAHFRELHQKRQSLDPISPVFAIEHDLSTAELDMLENTVRSGINEHYVSHFYATWLPFVVYAAEMGYRYEGDEYWTTFSSETPNWRSQERDTIRDWFRKFANDFGGARPSGAWASHFTIISWPITHAVLPVYLQRQFARLLFGFRTGLSSSLLENPDELGARLGGRAGLYGDRFRQFAQNTPLLGQVAVALLSGEDEESPYLISSTLARIVEGVSRERQARHWLSSARQQASRIRASGFRPHPQARGGRGSNQQLLPRATDPTFFLRFLGGTWHAHALLPDMTPIGERLTEVYDELRTRRARVCGSSRPVPRGALAYGDYEVTLTDWPDPAMPFVQLEASDESVNNILADQCVMTSGPWWVYRLRQSGSAVEVKGRFVRPGHDYILVGTNDQEPPTVSWVQSVPLRVEGVRAFSLTVPEQLSESDTAQLVDHGLSSLSSVAIRPVGIVASAWDGEGAGEWLAAEPAIIGINSELQPERCLVALDGVPFFPPWPSAESELLLSITDLEVGDHELAVSLVGAGGDELTSGTLAISIRDPRERPTNATAGEGIRMLASPARPTMAEIWDERASITVDGPSGAEAELIVSLCGEFGFEQARLRRKVHMPIDGSKWQQLAREIRVQQQFKDSYDDAESCVVTVQRDGVGMASLTCERGFQPLRWRFRTAHDGTRSATLSDRTDGGNTLAEFYTVDSPMEPLSREPSEAIALPPRGGLLRAASDTAEATALAPTNPNSLWSAGIVTPFVPGHDSSLAGVMKLVTRHHLWFAADLPADPFAVHQQMIVLEAIARKLAILVGGSRWAEIERRLERASDGGADPLDAMLTAVGTSPAHVALADIISLHLYSWAKPTDMLQGFAEAISQTLRECGVDDRQNPTAARFLLTLAGQPGLIMSWPEDERTFLLGRALTSPVLLRAARFAVLGTRIINDDDSVERSIR